jgi:hypothetical protein
MRKQFVEEVHRRVLSVSLSAKDSARSTITTCPVQKPRSMDIGSVTAQDMFAGMAQIETPSAATSTDGTIKTLYLVLYWISRLKHVPQGKLKCPRTTGAEELPSRAKGLIELG